MERRDIIMDQIRELSAAIGKIVAGFLGLNTEERVSHGIEIANEQFKEKLDIDISEVLSLDKATLVAYLQKRKLSSAHVETLADYLKEAGSVLADSNPALTRNQFERAYYF